MIDIVWVGMAFILGLLARQIGLPPLVGFLAGGFALFGFEVDTGDTLTALSDLGVTLLLFTIGLKLRIKSLLKPQVWAAGSIHMLVVTLTLGAGLMFFSSMGLGPFASMDGSTALLLAFALSFSSTIFAVKVLEDRGDVGSLYGLVMIGILIIQDLGAVIFMAASTGKLPTIWSLAVLIGLWPARWLLGQLLDRVGHGELVILFGLCAAIGASELFYAVGLKGDLGALLCGVLLAGHRVTDELSKSLLAFKDFFLVAFFLSVGMAGAPTADALWLALGLLLALPIKGVLFFVLLSRFHMRARTSLLATLGLTNYSEFGLIVIALAVSKGWLDPVWLISFAIALALSFVIGSPVNYRVLRVYEWLRAPLKRFEMTSLAAEEQQISPGPAAALVFGMGRVGAGGYDELLAEGIAPVVGIDSAPAMAQAHRDAGRTVIRASGTDLDFWDRLELDVGSLRLVLLTMPQVSENIFAAKQLRARGFKGRISALAKYEDHVEMLERAGVDRVFNLYREAGAGLADDAVRELPEAG